MRWRFTNADSIIVASRDRYSPAGDPDDEPPDWRWDEPGANRCDERIAALFRDNAYVVEAATADAVGGLQLALSSDLALDVFPDDSLDGERWRLLQPAFDVAHFVVSGARIHRR